MGLKSGLKRFGGLVKNKLKSAGSAIKSGVKQGAKWAWNNREGIGKAIGVGLDVASSFGVPGAGVVSNVIKGAVKNSGAKDKFFTGLSQSSPATSGYSLNTKSNKGTKEGRRVNGWKF